MPETIEDLGKRVKAKYPGQYDDFSDVDLGRKVKDKYPTQYGDFTDVAVKKYDPSTRGVRLNDRSGGPLQPAGVPENYGVDDAMGNLSTELHSVATGMTPALVPAVMSNPISTLLKLGAATGVQKGVEAGGTAMGAPGAGALIGDAAASLVPGGMDKINSLPMFDGITRPNYYQGGEQGIYDKASNLNPRDLIGFLMHPKAKLTKVMGKSIMDAIVGAAGEAGKTTRSTSGVPPLEPEAPPTPYRNPYTDEAQSFVSPGPRATQGVGAGPEVDAGINYPTPVDPQFPKPNLDTYGSPEAPQDPYTRLLTSDPRVHTPPGTEGVGAGPELDSGIRYPLPPKERPLSKAKQRAANATTLDSYGNPKPTDPRPFSSAPPEETPLPAKRGVGKGTMEYETLVGDVSKRLNLPSAAQAGEIPATGGSGASPEGISDSSIKLGKFVDASREIKSSVLAKYFKDSKVTPEELERLARESPAEVQAHSKKAGYPRGISPESLEITLRKLRAIQK